MMTPHNQMKSICHETQETCDANARSQCPGVGERGRGGWGLPASQDLTAKLFSFTVERGLMHKPPVRKTKEACNSVGLALTCHLTTEHGSHSPADEKRKPHVEECYLLRERNRGGREEGIKKERD